MYECSINTYIDMRLRRELDKVKNRSRERERETKREEERQKGGARREGKEER